MKNSKLLLLLSLLPVFTLGLSSCNTTNEVVNNSCVLRILNWEDYIYEQDIDEGYDAPDMVDQFVTYVKENYPQYSNVKVVYDTTDTNETMFNELQTGKSHYDLLCPSDYMIQKLLSQNLLEKMDRQKLPNYQRFVSEFMKQRLDTITAERKIDEENVVVEKLEDYVAGYMWGTLGLLFNPEFPAFVERGITRDEVIEDMSSYSALWDNKYKSTTSVKDSMRDTYAIGVLETYKDELQAARDLYLADPTNPSVVKTYNNKVSEIMNRCDSETISKVVDILGTLKENVYGLEVDSGKQDIVTKKIGINFAWSGDASYSIYQAHDEEQVAEPFDLLYSVPELGSNIWFDGWVIPKDETRSQEQYDLAHLFIDFISTPDNAAQNTEYIGYTSFIGGDAIVDYVRDCYDNRTDYVYYGEDYLSLYYLDPITDEECEVGYDVFFKEEDLNSAYDAVALYYYDENDNPIYINETYNERFVLQEDWEAVDLKYFFEGTLDEYSVDNNDHIFYSDDYLPFTNSDGSKNVSVGGHFFCALPNEDTMNRCAVMRDFGNNNGKILQMWENFKSDPLPLWATILFIAELAIGAGAVTYLLLNKVIKQSLRKKRKLVK